MHRRFLPVIVHGSEWRDEVYGYHSDGAHRRSKGMAPTTPELLKRRGVDLVSQAIPCFDQPDLKSTWTVTLIADEELTCLSNMDVKEEKNAGNGKKSVTFNKTPPMSTYVRAFWRSLDCTRLIPLSCWRSLLATFDTRRPTISGYLSVSTPLPATRSIPISPWT